MAGISRLRTLALQGVAAAVTALLIGGAAAALGQPLGEPTTVATELPTDGVTEGPTEGVTEGPTEGPTEVVTEDVGEEVTEDPADDVTEDAPEKSDPREPKTEHSGNKVSDAARGVLAPVGDCRNHGHWVSTVAKGLDSCDDNPRPSHAQVDEPAKPAKASPAGKAAKAKAQAKAHGKSAGR